MRKSFGIIIFAAVLVAALSFVARAAANAMVLVQDARPAATIVMRENAGRYLKGAVQALQGYVGRTSGAVLPITTDAEPISGARILVGASVATKGIGEDLSEKRLGYEGCVARTLSNDLVFLGPRDAGAANRVYWFLERKLDVHRFGLRDELTDRKFDSAWVLRGWGSYPGK